MAVPHKIYVYLTGASNTEIELLNSRHSDLCRNHQFLEDVLKRNVTTLAHAVHKALAGRGWLESAAIVDNEWELGIHTVKGAFNYYAHNQDPYELILNNIKGNHGHLSVQDKCGADGYKLLLYIFHDRKLIQEAKIVFDDPDDDFIGLCAKMP